MLKEIIVYITCEGRYNRVMINHFKLMNLLSPKIIYFDSMNNLTHAMKDMNITNSLKASVF